MKVALPLLGGCLCGQVRYELRGQPFMVYVCHCKDCQRQSGSAFGMSMPAPRSAFSITAGEPAAFERTMPSGRRSVVRFCAVCATRVFAESSVRVVTIRPGTLDETSWLRPAAQNFMRSAQSWSCIDDIPGFDTQPEAFEEIGRLWRQQGITFVRS